MGFKQLWRHAKLGQHTAFGARVFGNLVGHTLTSGGAGHGLHGIGKAFEIPHQAARVGIGGHPERHGLRLGMGQSHALFTSQFDQGLGAQTAIDVFVQADFGIAAQSVNALSDMD